MRRATRDTLWPVTRFAGTVKVNRPSLLVYEPTPSAGIETLAPGTGAAASLVTRPLTVVACWADAIAGTIPIRRPAPASMRYRLLVMYSAYLGEGWCAKTTCWKCCSAPRQLGRGVTIVVPAPRTDTLRARPIGTLLQGGPAVPRRRRAWDATTLYGARD